MTDEWGEPVAGGSTVHDFELEPTLIGVYRGSDEVDTKNGVSTIHRFLDDRYEQKDCWGSLDLDRKLAKVEKGARVRVQFLGRQETSSGNQMKMFEVRIANPGHSVKVADTEDDIPF